MNMIRPTLSRHESYDTFGKLNGTSELGLPLTRLPRVEYERSYIESHEAPAKLFSRSSMKSNSETDSENLLQIDYHSQKFFADLYDLTLKVNHGFKSKIIPQLAGGAMGGTYFLRDIAGEIKIICKPGDEEPNSPHNPYQTISHPTGYGGWFKGKIMPGFGMFREVSAFVLDEGFAGVPPTQLAKVNDLLLRNNTVSNSSSVMSFSPNSVISPNDYKICSIQSFIPNECTAEDMGTGKFIKEDVQRIAAFDIRVCNLDRHEGNILVTDSNPYEYLRRKKIKSLRQTSNNSSVDNNSNADNVYFHDNFGETDNENENEFSNEFNEFSHLETKKISSKNNILLKDGKKIENKDKFSDKLRLVPIDHGYILPHVLYMSDPSFCWMNWPQSSEPISQDLLDYIRSIDIKHDVEMLQKMVGAALPETSLLTLQVCTAFLKLGAEAGLTLSEMASAMTADWQKGKNSISPLQQSVHLAVHRSLCHEYINSQLLQLNQFSQFSQSSERSTSRSSLSKKFDQLSERESFELISQSFQFSVSPPSSNVLASLSSKSNKSKNSSGKSNISNSISPVTTSEEGETVISNLNFNENESSSDSNNLTPRQVLSSQHNSSGNLSSFNNNNNNNNNNSNNLNNSILGSYLLNPPSTSQQNFSSYGQIFHQHSMPILSSSPPKFMDRSSSGIGIMNNNNSSAAVSISDFSKISCDLSCLSDVSISSCTVRVNEEMLIRASRLEDGVRLDREIESVLNQLVAELKAAR